MELEAIKTPPKRVCNLVRFKAWTHDHFKRQNGVNAALPNALFGDLDPDKTLRRESPLHRKVIELAEKGCNHREIAAVCEISDVHVSRILRQPWARERMINDLHEDTVAEFKSLLEAEVIPNLRVVTEIRDSETSKPETKLAACRELWDRFLGKPNQPITTGPTVDPSKLNDKEILERIAASGAVSAGTPAPTEDKASPSPVG